MEQHTAVDRLAALILEHESRATEVARLLHDNAGQTLTAIGFHLQALGADAEATTRIQEYLAGALENVRFACNRLQRNVIERSGLSLAIELLVDRFREEAGLEIRTNINVQGAISPSTGFAVYRIIELAANNIAAHAGVNHAELRLTAGDMGLSARISDLGCGFDAAQIHTQPLGTGFVLMKAYANSSRLQLRIDSSRSQGTIVLIQTF
ncbi:MAG: hypothetical protein JNM66_27905 [Bryobacterales bacterium]|nr:hypothetical protein [Bryobacterales bacterium]